MNRRQFLTCSAFGLAAIGGCSRADNGSVSHLAALAGRSLRRKFSFLHTYEATGRYWQGIEGAGLIRRSTGIRLINSPWGPDEHRFNNAARIGGQLHQILRRRHCAFLIDRVVGGSPYRAYLFDPALIRAYEDLLGNNFLGGQVHEPVSNTHNDWERLLKANKNRKAELMRPERLRDYFDGSDDRRWLEYGTLEDYAWQIYPADSSAWWADVELMIRRQAARFAGRFCTCEGNQTNDWAWHTGYQLGACSVMAETGPDASAMNQFAVAAIRGAARAAGRSWGIFFAPWGPDGCTAFLPAQQWSWHCATGKIDPNMGAVGPEHGPSSALQRRVFFHAYISGANTLHEEWGAECNLESLETGKLSSYGRVTKDFLDFQDACPDIGRPFTPLAVVRNALLHPPEIEVWKKLKFRLREYSVADYACAARIDSGQAESNVYSPWAVPEIFDIVPSDAPASAWRKYECILAVDGSIAPRAARLVPAEELGNAVVELAIALSPFQHSSHLPMQINYRSVDRAWVLALYNPWGARRGDVLGSGSLLDEGCTQQDVIRPKFSVGAVKTIHAWPKGSLVEVRGNLLHVTLGPGGTLVMEVHPRP